MIISEIEQTLETIIGSTNPEIYHFQRGSHPGIKWYIKTIIPGYRLLTDDTYTLWAMWRHLTEHFPNLVKITNIAYYWDGKSIPGWWTIWLDQKIDIRVSWSREAGFDWKMVDYDIGLKMSAVEIEALLETNYLNDRLSNLDVIHYKQILYILEFLKTYTPDKRSKANRKKIRVIEDAEIFDETIDNE